jgi:diaminopimelate epimerase
MVKLEAAGNDFLALLAPSASPAQGATHHGAQAISFSPAQVRALCDRRRGVGADGLIIGRVMAPPALAQLEMTLFNADGSVAEMSGNGIRCLVHAAVDAGVVSGHLVHVMTGAGLRRVTYEPGSEGLGWARVEMGPVRLGRELPSLLDKTRARLADVGNPHLVIIGEVTLGELELDELGVPALQAAGGPVNLEVVRQGRLGADLELRVLERGVGETLACGTGTCAAAAVARTFGLVGDLVTVDNPGGRLEVSLGAVTRRVPRSGGELDTVVDAVELGGPVRRIAEIRVDAAFFEQAHEPA